MPSDHYDNVRFSAGTAIKERTISAKNKLLFTFERWQHSDRRYFAFFSPSRMFDRSTTGMEASYGYACGRFQGVLLRVCSFQ